LKRSDSLKTWAFVLGLLLFTGLASAAYLWFSSQEDTSSSTETASVAQETQPITVSIGDYVLGDELLGIPFVNDKIEGTQLNPWIVVIAAIILVSVLIGGIGTALAVVSLISSRQVAKVYSDEEYQHSAAALSQREQETVKELQETRPVAASDPPERKLRWSLITSALLIVILVWAAGLAFGIAFFGDTTWQIFGADVSVVTVINIVLVAITIAIIAITIRAHEPGELDSSKSDYNPVNWSYVWIILSGVLILGIGAGLAILSTTMPSS